MAHPPGRVILAEAGLDIVRDMAQLHDVCFSPEASFTAAAFCAAAGAACLLKAGSVREMPLAAAPLVFALQQGVEGLVWLDTGLADGARVSTPLTFSFLLIAQVIWPILAPAAALAMEDRPGRRRFMLMGLLLGASVALFLLWNLVFRGHTAQLAHGHIVYSTGLRYGELIGAAYLLAAGLPLLISSRRAVALFGAITLAGAIVALWLHQRAFQSMWCFFAAAASVVLVAYFFRAPGFRPPVPAR